MSNQTDGQCRCAAYSREATQRTIDSYHQEIVTLQQEVNTLSYSRWLDQHDSPHGWQAPHPAAPVGGMPIGFRAGEAVTHDRG